MVPELMSQRWPGDGKVAGEKLKFSQQASFYNVFQHLLNYGLATLPAEQCCRRKRENHQKHIVL